MASNKIILKVVEHGKDTTKCRWGVFLNDLPLAECDALNAIKSGRNVHKMALWAKEYAESHGYKITKLIQDATEDTELKKLTDEAQELSAEKAKADKAASEKLEALLSAKTDDERKTLRKEWGELCEIAAKAATASHTASAAAIAASDEWFEKRKAEKSVKA